MKKAICLLMSLLLLLSLAAGSAEEAGLPEAEENTEAAETGEPVGFDHLYVGNPTPMRGEFFTGMWGNATSDSDVRDLLHGYNLVVWDGNEAMFTADTSVVTDVTATANEAGDHSYVITLANDLYYSDGTKITAWDYAFSYLFSIAPELEDIGAVPMRREHLLGYQAYVEKTSRVLSGVRVPSDNTIIVTLNGKYLPFFYELALLQCNPYPISVIAPGVTVKDDGDGVYLDGEFTAELLRKTILDPETGYQSHPAVVCGPYTLTSWDGVKAEFAINPYYKGNRYGEKPTIPRLTYTLAENDTMLEKLENGEFNLLDKVTRADSIQGGIAMTGDAFRMTTYPRVGVSYFSFACEKPTVSSVAVRQAFAWCLDRDALTAAYTGNFGQRVDGYYGIGQWMYGLVTGAIDPPVDLPEEGNAAAAQAYEAELEKWKELNLDNLTQYTLDLEKAKALLDEDGWTLNAEGLREKDGVVLDLHLSYPQGNNINEALETLLIPNLKEVGIRLTMEAVPMGELLSRWYKQEERDEDIVYLASNFDLVFDPSVNFANDVEGKRNWDYTNDDDEQLYEWTLAMRKTEPGDVLDYMKRWISFQERFNETLPMLPVYSNMYFDFYVMPLQNFRIAESATWGVAIVGAYMSDEEPAQAENEEPVFQD